VYSFIPRPKVPVTILYLENMLVVFLRTFGRQRPQQIKLICTDYGWWVDFDVSWGHFYKMAQTKGYWWI
jgi:hypothetical protein